MLNLRIIRKQRGLTMKELGAKVGASESAIGYIETGKRNPSFELLLKLGEALDCSVADLLCEEKIESALPSPSIPALSLSPEETQLIEDYRDASDEIREEASGMLHRSAERNRQEEYISSATAG